MLTYASALTETPSLVSEEDVDRLAAAGWSPEAIWEATALISFFNFSGRMERASGLPQDRIPDGAALAEARVG